MGVRGKSKYTEIIKIGDIFGNWTVLSDPFSIKTDNVYIKNNKKYVVSVWYVKCKCSCGKEFDVNCYNIVNKKSERCYPCSVLEKNGSSNPAWTGYEEIPGSWFKRYTNHKIERKQFTLSKEDVWDLFLKQDRKCALTGIDISFENIGEKSDLVCSASLDRINSDLPYSKENVQLVHKDVNLMKNHFSQEYFIEMCKKVAENNRGGIK